MARLPTLMRRMLRGCRSAHAEEIDEIELPLKLRVGRGKSADDGGALCAVPVTDQRNPLG